MDNQTYDTSPGRVVLALMVGAALGTAITSADYLIGLYRVNGPDHFATYGLQKSASVSLIAYPIWLVFITVFGGPVWLLLHKLALRSWFAAVISGAIISFIVTLAMQTGMFTGRASSGWSYYGSGGEQWSGGVMTPFGWKIALIGSADFALIGGIVALVIWAVGYRKLVRGGANP
jgi:hypothetical protein